MTNKKPLSKDPVAELTKQYKDLLPPEPKTEDERLEQQWEYRRSIQRGMSLFELISSYPIFREWLGDLVIGLRKRQE